MGKILEEYHYFNQTNYTKNNMYNFIHKIKLPILYKKKKRHRCKNRLLIHWEKVSIQDDVRE